MSIKVRCFLSLLFVFFCVPAVFHATEVLVEAESFQKKGGWVVDQQFVATMGSPYLLAHGMGIPVADAVTEVVFPKAGTYRLWVRAKNWVPGPWEAPGRFRVMLDGKNAGPVFGTEDGWNWQDGGKVRIEKAGKVSVALHDLTGFEGRCDALFFTDHYEQKPPIRLKALRAWRDRLTKAPKVPPPAGAFDLVVVGGGIAGCAAALAADEEGLSVALIQDRPVLGGNASKEVRVHTIGIHGKGKWILEKIDTRHYPNGSAEAVKDQEKRRKNMQAAENVSLFLCWRAYQTVTDDNMIKAVYARHTETGKTLRFEAPLFVDATGDGWIGYWAGADYRMGREACSEFDEWVDKYDELWSPRKADTITMGTSVLWNSEKADQPVSFPEVPWAMDVAKDHVAVSGEWYWEYHGKDTIYDAEHIRDHLFRAIYGSFSNAKKLEKYSNVKLKWVAYVAGKRESRRLMGDYIYTMQDVVRQRKFKDAVVMEKRDIDLHYQLKLKGKPYDFLSRAIYVGKGMYYVPFRCLYSRNIKNLMMAGRCFSCSHVGLGGPRVMLTCGQMGIAVGKAAAVCKKYGILPRDIHPSDNKVRELQRMVGGEFPAPDDAVDAP